MPPRRAAAQPAPGVNPVAQRIFNDLHKGRVTELQVKQLTMTIRSDWTWLLQCAEHRENRSCCVNLQFENGSTKEQVNATHSHVQNFVIKHKDDWWGVVIVSSSPAITLRSLQLATMMARAPGCNGSRYSSSPQRLRNLASGRRAIRVMLPTLDSKWIRKRQRSTRRMLWPFV